MQNLGRKKYCEYRNMVGPNSASSLFLQSVCHPFYGVLLLKKKILFVYSLISELKILILCCFKLYSCSYLYFLNHCSLPVASLIPANMIPYFVLLKWLRVTWGETLHATFLFCSQTLKEKRSLNYTYITSVCCCLCFTKSTWCPWLKSWWTWDLLLLWFTLLDGLHAKMAFREWYLGILGAEQKWPSCSAR